MAPIEVALVAGLVALATAGPIAYFVALQQSRRMRFEDRRDEVIAELSGQMYRVQDDYFHWFSFSAGPKGTPAEEIVERHIEKAHIAVGSQNDLIRHFYS